MSIRYSVKKRVFGFDETKTEKYVAQSYSLGTVNFKQLCDDVTKVGLVPRGAVKFVLDALIDTLEMNMTKGFTVQLGDFGTFRPAINAHSQTKAEDVTAHTIRRRKIIFTPGASFQIMLKSVGLTRMDATEGGTTTKPGEGGNTGGDGGGIDPDPLG